MTTEYLLDNLADLYAEWKYQAAYMGLHMPCALSMGVDGTEEYLLHTWTPGPGTEAAHHAAAMVLRTAPTWACLCADAHVTLGMTADELATARRGDATAAYQAGAPEATEALVITWVALGATPVVLVHPYTVDNGHVAWDTANRLDSRYTDGAMVSGLVPTVLTDALHAAQAVRQ